MRKGTIMADKMIRSVALRAFPNYKGRKIRADWSGRVSFYDLNWSGGTRNQYRSVHLSDGQTRSMPNLAPWVNPIEGQSAAIPPGCAVVEHSMFCGRDLGLRVYFPSSDGRVLTPASLEA
jgi:hypothetical protein